MTNEIIENRSEIIFFYETNNNNPNGDPMYENRPRMDENTNRCLVSDVRLKRNIRDYLLNKGETILVSDWENQDGTIRTANERALSLAVGANSSDYTTIKEKLIEKCIDTRLFGCAIPLGKGNRSIQLTGPIQFLYGVSEHPVQVDEIQGTAAFASSSGDKQRSFRNEFLIPFALIKFYGVINETLAQETKMTNNDLVKFDNAIWEGTLNLQSRSKIGHKPRLYIRIVYKKNESQIGLIHQKINIKYNSEIDGTELRKIDQIQFDLSKMKSILESNKNKIEKIIFRESEDLQFDSYDSFEKFLTKIEIKSEKLK
ncbi:MAG: type I-B CRISPR-associated protein Cas7/Csh2 [Promethearchaeota archaeon]